MEIKKISENIYEIPKQGKMNVPVKIYASENLIKDIKKDKTLEQAKNVAQLPGIINQSIVLPDAHQGYGFSIGGVAGFDASKEGKGVISPGGVGYDINCSVRLLRTNLTRKDLEENKEKIATGLSRKIPSGLGRGSSFQVSHEEFKKILTRGAQYLVKKGYGKKDDYLHLEEEGCLEGADTSKVSDKAIKRGIGQLGTLGSGNHFLDVQIVDEIFDKDVAEKFRLEKNQVVIMIHCGSRGLGHQIASDYIKKMEKEYGFKDLPDRELVCAPINSKLGKDYYSAMACAVNFAFANKQIMVYWIRDELERIFSHSKKVDVEVVYDVCHNIAKFEYYDFGSGKKKVCVHRKGATRAFGAGRKEIPKAYREIGQPVLIPGSMGTPSYVLVGTKKSEEMTFGSSVHGAGRNMSRSKALKKFSGKNLMKELEKKGITIKSGSMKSFTQEVPGVYKDINEVVRTVHDLGISKKVAKLIPKIVIIG